MLDPELVASFDRIGNQIRDLDHSLRASLDQRIQEVGLQIENLDRSLRALLDQRIGDLDRSLRALFDHRIEEVGLRIQDLDQSLRALFDERNRETRILIEDLHTNIQVVAEGVLANGERLDSFRIEVGSQFDEVRRSNRLSYLQLERKLAALGN